MSFETKTFTNSPRNPRHTHSPVRDRCVEYIQILKDLGIFRELPISQAIHVFQTEMGIMDERSISRYFGTHDLSSSVNVRTRTRYATGTISIKDSQVSRMVKHKRGYLEVFGLVKFDLRGSTRFMVLNEVSIFATVSSLRENESFSRVSIPEMYVSSTTPILQGKECEKTVLEVVSPNSAETTEREERENNSGHIQIEYGNRQENCPKSKKALTAEEILILTAAESCDSELKKEGKKN